MQRDALIKVQKASSYVNKVRNNQKHIVLTYVEINEEQQVQAMYSVPARPLSRVSGQRLQGRQKSGRS